MFIRNHKGKIITFEPNKFYSEYEKYIKLWKIKYNIDLDKSNKTVTMLRSITDYVNGIKDSV